MKRAFEQSEKHKQWHQAVSLDHAEKGVIGK